MRVTRFVEETTEDPSVDFEREPRVFASQRGARGRALRGERFRPVGRGTSRKVAVPRDATKERPTPFAERPRVKQKASLDVGERTPARARVGISGDELGEPGGGRVVDQRESQRVENLHFRDVAQNLRGERFSQNPLQRVDVRGVRPMVAFEHFVQVALGAYQQPVRVAQRV